MCFMLYAGTTRPIARSEWKKEAPDICVCPLAANETAVNSRFSLPEIQFIGSTSGCGCDFPHVLRQNGEWRAAIEDEVDHEYEQTCKLNREAV